MPFITLPDGFGTDIYNMLGQWTDIQKQLIPANPTRTELNTNGVKNIRFTEDVISTNKIVRDKRTDKSKSIANENKNKFTSSRLIVTNNADKNYDSDDDEIKELKHLPSLFKVDSSNLRLNKRDSQISVISDLSVIADHALDDISEQEFDDDSLNQMENEDEETKEEKEEKESEEESLPDLPWAQLVSDISFNDDVILSQRGYTKLRTICETSQGEIMECIKVDKRDIDCEYETESDIKHVAIKKADKILWKQKVSKEDEYGMSFCIEDDIMKQALILHHLTVDNSSSGNYIVKYIEFFESAKNFYLVMEYIEDDMNLKQFVKKAHQYINDGKLSLKEYQHFVKYLLWQLSAVIHWLHHDMHC